MARFAVLKQSLGIKNVHFANIIMIHLIQLFRLKKGKKMYGNMKII